MKYLFLSYSSSCGRQEMAHSLSELWTHYRLKPRSAVAGSIRSTRVTENRMYKVFAIEIIMLHYLVLDIIV